MNQLLELSISKTTNKEKPLQVCFCFDKQRSFVRYGVIWIDSLRKTDKVERLFSTYGCFVSVDWKMCRTRISFWRALDENWKTVGTKIVCTKTREMIRVETRTCFYCHDAGVVIPHRRCIQPTWRARNQTRSHWSVWILRLLFFILLPSPSTFANDNIDDSSFQKCLTNKRKWRKLLDLSWVSLFILCLLLILLGTEIWYAKKWKKPESR